MDPEAQEAVWADSPETLCASSFPGKDASIEKVDGGLVVSGEPYWRREPSAEYLAGEGLRADVFATHAGNVATATGQALRFLHAIVSSHDDWDRYEGYQTRAVGPLLYSEIIKRAVSMDHLDYCEASWVLDDNDAMNRAIEAMGATHYKTWRMYRREL